MRALVLASTSTFRRRILEDAGLTVRCVSPGVDESTFQQPDPAARARALALAKARAVRVDSDEVVIGADQVIVDPVSGEIFGKPKDDKDHLRRLKSLRGRPHTLITGFCVLRGDTQIVGEETTSVVVRGDLTDDELARYVASGEARGCAGGYAAEATGGFLIARIDGDWTNVIGLPIFRVFSALRALGWRFGGSVDGPRERADG